MIGIFDSGVGGLSILCEIQKIQPNARITYFADSANFPYGDKTQEELKTITRLATQRLLDNGADIVVVACNSATVSTISALRGYFPGVVFVGVEPAVKLAYEKSRDKEIGLLATKKTVRSHDSEGLAPGVTIYKHFAPILIDRIENSYQQVSLDDLRSSIKPFLARGISTIILGCTHFYFVRKSFEKQFPEINFIEPAKIIAERVLGLAPKCQLGASRFLVSGRVDSFSEFLENVVGYKDADIRQV